jgi:hypothetical protein
LLYVFGLVEKNPDQKAVMKLRNLDLYQLYINNIFVFYREELKKALEKIKNFDDLLCDIVNICLLMFEQKTYLTPAEKHMLVKVGMKKNSCFLPPNIVPVCIDAR